MSPKKLDKSLTNMHLWPRSSHRTCPSSQASYFLYLFVCFSPKRRQQEKWPLMFVTDYSQLQQCKRGWDNRCNNYLAITEKSKRRNICQTFKRPSSLFFAATVNFLLYLSLIAWKLKSKFFIDILFGVWGFLKKKHENKRNTVFLVRLLDCSHLKKD